ncbi:F-box protein [Legionella clemsonensis]|uniref:F-box domain-containing protein n=1 Tax=Legionella clemsonensis TaxID=1867846 RepID=A0A222P1S3_9GAMM|nr:F-box protein [Legionella clemsonensis]ASQ45787.1 hypothetical protein clem_06160 [Legionella clemsonensis]
MNNDENDVNWLSLPLDTWREIFSFLTAEELAIASLSCKKIHAISMDEQVQAKSPWQITDYRPGKAELIKRYQMSFTTPSYLKDSQWITTIASTTSQAIVATIAGWEWLDLVNEKYSEIIEGGDLQGMLAKSASGLIAADNGIGSYAHVFDTTQGNIRCTIAFKYPQQSVLGFLTDDRLITGEWGGYPKVKSIFIWNSSTAKLIKQISIQIMGFRIAVLDNQHVALLVRDYRKNVDSLNVLNIDSELWTATLDEQPFGSFVDFIALGNQYIVSALEYNGLKIYDAFQGTCLTHISEQHYNSCSLVPLNARQFISYSTESYSSYFEKNQLTTMRIWDAVTGKSMAIANELQKTSPSCISVLPDGKLLTYKDKKLTLWSFPLFKGNKTVKEGSQEQNILNNICNII